MNKNILQEAEDDKSRGLSELKTCSILFKCKPNYERAIPYFKNAAQNYAKIRNTKEEIFCRNKLVECFRQLKEFWQEGNELEQLSFLHLNELNDHKESLTAIINAHNAYYAQGEYQESSNCIKKIALLMKQQNQLDICEKMLKISYNSSLKYGHLVISKDDVSDFIYKTFHFYFGILIANNKTRIAIESCDPLAKSIESYEKDKSEIFSIYLCKLIAMIINEESDNEISIVIKKCEEWIKDRDDESRLQAVLKVKEAVSTGNLKLFTDNLYQVSMSLDNEVTKKLKQLLDKNSQHNNQENFIEDVKDSKRFEDHQNEFI